MTWHEIIKTVDFTWTYTVNGEPCEICQSGDFGWSDGGGWSGHTVMGKHIKHDKKKLWFAIPNQPKGKTL